MMCDQRAREILTHVKPRAPTADEGVPHGHRVLDERECERSFSHRPIRQLYKYPLHTVQTLESKLQFISRID